MDKIYEPLFTSWKIGNCQIKNRIVLTSMGGTSIFGWMEKPHFDEEAADFLLTRAKHGAGLILPGIAPLRNPLGNEWLYQNKRMYRKLKDFMDEFHKTGCKLFIQLTAGFGRSFAVTEIMEKVGGSPVLKTLAKPILDIDYLCASASPNPNRWSDKIKTRALSKDEINKMIEAFAKTAFLCKEAGVDGVEIHAVHEGYLLDQFTMKYTNQREDEYGGSFENRYRFPVEIVKAVKEKCGSDFPVSLRYSVVSKTKGFRSGALPGEQYVEVGRDMEESEKAAKYLQDAGYDMLNCDNGTYDAWYWSHPPLYMPENCNLADCEHIKQFVDIPVVAAGRMDPKVAAASIKENKIDGMGVARQFLADPAWVEKLENGKEEDILPCICCHNGCFNMAHYKGVPNDQDLSDSIHMARCAVNAETMQTHRHFIKKTKNPLHIAVIGGGIGGMETARVAALRGHHVTIYEKSNQLGGVFVAAASPSFKEKDKGLLNWYSNKMKEMSDNIEVKLNTEVKDLASLAEDKIVVCTGAIPRRIAFPGSDLAIEATDYLSGKKQVGEKVVVVGGGLTGSEIAYDLYLKGKHPTIIEIKDDIIAQKGVCMANSTYLREFFALHGVPIFLESRLCSIDENGAKIRLKDGKMMNLACDSVILSVGYIPNPLPDNGEKVYLVGDCDSVGNLKTVIWGAYEVAMKL